MTLPVFCENGAPLDLAEVPRLTERQRAIVWLTAIGVALTRFYAVSKSMWDWDEALFCSAMREFDVTQHHPHPPGFPLFIAAAHVTRIFATSDFRALQAVTVIAVVLLFPLAFALARSLAMSFAESYSAALLLVFLPNVWFYGRTAFSDISALAVILAAAAALFASRSGERRLYLIGCILFGAAIAFRQQNALLGMYPWLSASWTRLQRRRVDVVGALAVVTVAVAWYAGAALVSDSVSRYIGAVRGHEAFMATIVSLRRTALAEALQVLVSAVLVVTLAIWTAPALELVRTTDSPPFAACRWIAQHATRADHAVRPRKHGAVHGVSAGRVSAGRRQGRLLAERRSGYATGLVRLRRGGGFSGGIELRIGCGRSRGTGPSTSPCVRCRAGLRSGRDGMTKRAPTGTCGDGWESARSRVCRLFPIGASSSCASTFHSTVFGSRRS
jgi:hypothetical protein